MLVFVVLQKCADHRVSDKTLYPTFARTLPPATQVTKSIVALLMHFGWRRYTMVVGSTTRWQSIADQLQSISARHNVTVNARFDFQEPYTVEDLNNPMETIVTDSYLDTRSEFIPSIEIYNLSLCNLRFLMKKQDVKSGFCIYC